MARLSPQEAGFRDSGLPSDVVRVANPTDQDFDFVYKNEENNDIRYVITAGQTKMWPRYLACHYVAHMIDKIITEKRLLDGDPLKEIVKNDKQAPIPEKTNDVVRRQQIFPLLVLEVIQTDSGEVMPPEEQRVNDDETYPTGKAYGVSTVNDDGTPRDFAKEAQSVLPAAKTEATEDEVPNEPVQEPEPPKKPVRIKPTVKRSAAPAKTKK